MSPHHAVTNVASRQLNGSVNVKRLAHMLGVRPKTLRRWIQLHHKQRSAKRKCTPYVWTAPEAAKIIANYRPKRPP